MEAAERAGLDYVFLADGWGPGGPVSEELGIGDLWLFAPLLAGVLIGASEHIKIITTIHQAFLHPLVIARMGANLDALSGGRWGMNAVSGAGFAPDLIGSTSPTTDHDALYDPPPNPWTSPSKPGATKAKSTTTAPTTKPRDASSGLTPSNTLTR